MAFKSWAMSAILVMALGIVGQYSTSANPTRSPNRNCRRTIRNCDRPWRRFLHDNLTQVPELCARFSTMQTCQRECQASVPRRYRMSYQAMRYVCHPSRREEMLQAAAAPCLQDRGVLTSTLSRDIPLCVNRRLTRQDMARIRRLDNDSTLTTQSDELCPSVENILDCLPEVLRPVCGEDVAQVLRAIYRVAAREMIGHKVPACFRQDESQ